MRIADAAHRAGCGATGRARGRAGDHPWRARLGFVRRRPALALLPAAPADAIVDPTGCGDAYRAGLLHGLAQGWPWLDCGRLASVLGRSRSPAAAGRTTR
ncbi:MAG: PfkB family carbohydrate kinase [Rivihabitans pingtungensis]